MFIGCLFFNNQYSNISRSWRINPNAHVDATFIRLWEMQGMPFPRQQPQQQTQQQTQQQQTQQHTQQQHQQPQQSISQEQLQRMLDRERQDETLNFLRRNLNIPQTQTSQHYSTRQTQIERQRQIDERTRQLAQNAVVEESEYKMCPICLADPLDNINGPGPNTYCQEIAMMQ
jgi:hypothetical protein